MKYLGSFGGLLARYSVFIIVVILAVVTGFLARGNPVWVFPCAILAGLVLLGIWNIFQTHHTLLRNYPLTAHFRWSMEQLRPYLRQYIVEGDLTGRPIPRQARTVVYQRSKKQEDAHPFGTELDAYSSEYEFLCHSVAPKKKADKPFRVDIGGEQCKKPYSASIFNVSAMSFGALGAKAVETLNLAASRGNFFHDTGEGGISPYHLKHGGDLVWEVGSGYFGCRTKDGKFDAGAFADKACDDRVKMVEIKLSQGAKPGHGGLLPGAKVTKEIAKTRDVEIGEDCLSPSYHTAFSTPTELLEFVARMRELSGGKPAGFKLCVGHPAEFMAICKAMHETGIKPDFIVVDGGEGGTGAAPQELSDHVGMPLREGLILVRNALEGAGLRDGIRIGASGKIIDGFSLAANLAIGADWGNSARGFMFALGCVMSLKCHTDRCPTGVTTQDPVRQRALVVGDKSERVQNFHSGTVRSLAELLAASGLENPAQLGPHMIYHRVSPIEAKRLDEIYDFLEPGVLLDDPESVPLGMLWKNASADSFQPLAHDGRMRRA